MGREKNHTGFPKSLYERITAAREILGIPEEATMETIKNAFREKILLRHPAKCREPLPFFRLSTALLKKIVLWPRISNRSHSPPARDLSHPEPPALREKSLQSRLHGPLIH